jgi:hypothetical protein
MLGMSPTVDWCEFEKLNSLFTPEFLFGCLLAACAIAAAKHGSVVRNQA